MSGRYDEWYKEFKESMDQFGEDELFDRFDQLIRSGRNTFAFNRRLMEKAIDVSWVEAIENGLQHIDKVLRAPSRTIVDVEEIVPIALSRKITVESVKHLAQHTDLIQSYDKKTGKITPSKILNVHKEESLMTYENKFINTLIDRLYIFITTRYEKLAQVSRAEQVFTLGYDTLLDDGKGGSMRINLRIESTESLENYNDHGYTVWQRVEKLKKIIEGYKGSELCQKLGNTYVRPPIMRTNAIMKNVDVKACLTLWQYIVAYDKVGYEINAEDTAMKPEMSYIEDFYKIVALNFLLFRSYTADDDSAPEELKTKKLKPNAPKYLKRFENELSTDYGIISDTAVGYIAADGDFRVEKKMPADIRGVFEQVTEAVKIEKAYIAELENQMAEEERLRQEAEERRLELERIEEARQAELERIRRQKEEEERKLQEMLEQKRAEQEAEERERERLEQERLARLEEQRKREEEARIKAEEERKRREEEERAEAERQRIAEEKKQIRAELGGTEDSQEDAEEKRRQAEEQAYSEVTEEEIEQAKEAMEQSEQEFEDPRAVAARMKLEQQQREKERMETERAQRLKAERQKFESKPFLVIYKEYSKNPIYAVPRVARFVMAERFDIIPEDTDNPDWKRRLAEIEEEKRIKAEEQKVRSEMEVYYRKYAQTFNYRFRRAIEDYKFKKKRREQEKSKPKPVYTPPNRTPEEQAEINAEMQRLYREYHVSLPEKISRHFEDKKRKKEAILEATGELEKIEAEAQHKTLKSRIKGVLNAVVTVLIVLMLALVVFTMVRSSQGKAVSIFGRSLLRVTTGSMEPSIQTDDYIYIRKTDPSTLSEGDIIAYYSHDKQIEGSLVTHRIETVNADGTFVTKGDANLVEDSLTVAPEDIAGKYVGKARLFIWINSFADPRKLLLLLVIIPMMFASLYEVRSIAKIGREAVKARDEQKEKLMRQAIEREKQRLADEGYTGEEEGGTEINEQEEETTAGTDSGTDAD